jgi:small subunit ribosomal protein S1
MSFDPDRAWAEMERIRDEGGSVSGPVIEIVKGGLVLDIGVRGFLPASLVEFQRVRDLLPYVGKVLECKVIEVGRHRNIVLLSRRAWLEEKQSKERADLITRLRPDESGEE